MMSPGTGHVDDVNRSGFAASAPKTPLGATRRVCVVTHRVPSRDGTHRVRRTGPGAAPTPRHRRRDGRRAVACELSSSAPMRSTVLKSNQDPGGSSCDAECTPGLHKIWLARTGRGETTPESRKTTENVYVIHVTDREPESEGQTVNVIGSSISPTHP